MSPELSFHHIRCANLVSCFRRGWCVGKLHNQNFDETCYSKRKSREIPLSERTTHHLQGNGAYSAQRQHWSPAPESKKPNEQFMITGNSGYVRCPMIFRQNAGVNYPGGCQLLFRNISTRKLERTKMKHLNIEKSKHWLTERRYPVSVEAGLSLKGLQCFHHIGVNKEIEFSLEFTACLDTVK